MTSRVLRIGHRGAAGHAPENTLAAIEKGIALGCDYVEIDVQAAVDGPLIVMHDKRVDRTTNGRGYVAELSVAELRALDAGHGERVPLLDEVLSAISGRAGVMIEIITPGIAARVTSAVRKSGMRGPVLYASFLHSELTAVREVDPTVQTMALFEGVPVGGGRFLLEGQPSHVGVGFDSITPEFVRELQALRLVTFVYTLNDPRDIDRAKAFGVDGVISDYPERV